MWNLKKKKYNKLVNKTKKKQIIDIAKKLLVTSRARGRRRRGKKGKGVTGTNY